LDYPKTTWRLIRSHPAPGAWNMAVDEAILEVSGLGQVPPTLRLYAWDPPCLSLGYAQPVGDVDQEALKACGWDLVRRPTGGRAILHTDELTYSIIGQQDDPRLAGSVIESYQRLSQALLQALTRLGIPAVAEANPVLPAGSDPKGPVCFEVPSTYEITYNHKKLIGSAQARRKGVVLQHGSFPLQGDLRRIIRVLRFEDEEQRLRAAQRVHARAATAEEILGSAPTWEQTAAAFSNAFQQVLPGLEFAPLELNDFEIETANQLVQEKYNHPQWTGKV
jgi:lipoate-protein ligase A